MIIPIELEKLLEKIEYTLVKGNVEVDIKDLLSIEESAGKVKKLNRENDEHKKVKDSTSSSK